MGDFDGELKTLLKQLHIPEPTQEWIKAERYLTIAGIHNWCNNAEQVETRIFEKSPSKETPAVCSMLKQLWRICESRNNAGGAGKWRVIDDAKLSGHNSAAGCSERIHTTCTDFGLMVAKELHKLCQSRGIHVSVRDMKKAFKQVPVNDEDRAFSITAVYCPQTKEWLFGELPSLACGQVHAVVGFNRVPAFICVAARRLLAIPVTRFYDDFKVIDIDCEDADFFFGELCDILGFKFDTDKWQKPSARVTYLGKEEDYSMVPACHTVDVSLKDQRRQELLGMIAEAQASKHCDETLCN